MNSIMNLTTSETLVLVGLLDLAQADRAATLIRLAAETDLSRQAVEAGLGRLDRAGLADRERLRLTLTGLALALAVAPRARRLRRPRVLAA